MDIKEIKKKAYLERKSGKLNQIKITPTLNKFVRTYGDSGESFEDALWKLCEKIPDEN